MMTDQEIRLEAVKLAAKMVESDNLHHSFLLDEAQAIERYIARGVK